MSKHYVFYSWQSDLPSNANRNFIEQVLQRAIKEISSDDLVNMEATIDKDTYGIPGSPNIAEVILKKIEQAQVFVCDVSIINPRAKHRKTPNPNVLYELGYASAKLGSNRIILVLNSAYGKVESLPFDLKMMRTITYHIKGDELDKSAERKKLQGRLEQAIISIITGRDEHKYRVIDHITSDEDAFSEVFFKLSMGHPLPKDAIAQIIKQRMGLYEKQAQLLVEYFIDFEYIKPMGTGSQIYILGSKGGDIYRKYTEAQEETRKISQAMSDMMNGHLKNQTNNK